jgi:hypothetical protein
MFKPQIAQRRTLGDLWIRPEEIEDVYENVL